LIQGPYEERLASKALSQAAERAIQEVDRGLPVYDVRTIREKTAMASTFVVMQSTFAGIFAVIALVLAATGIYGVMAYRTKLRTHEIGIRVALGASRADLMRLVLLQGMRLTAIGLALGLALSVRADPRHCRSAVRHRRQ
jgi:ABC-type antimicrobial peptide transport system permease subunit